MPFLQPVMPIITAQGALLLAPLPAALLLFDATFLMPQSALCSVIAGASAMLLRAGLNRPARPRQIDIFNACLAGQMVATALAFEVSVLFLAALAGIASFAIHDVLGTRFQSMRGLKALSFPGIIAALGITVPATLLGLAPHDMTAGIDNASWGIAFLKSLGSLVGAPSPLAGLLVGAAILITSRTFALIAIVSFALAQGLVIGLTGHDCEDIRIAIGLNAMLTGIVLSGLCPYGLAGRLAIPLTGVILAAIASLACAPLFVAVPAFPLHAPFLVATFLCFGVFHPTNLATFARRRFA